ncbi:hypothetical protein D3C87_1589610 [compost metagenome]
MLQQECAEAFLSALARKQYHLVLGSGHFITNPFEHLRAQFFRILYGCLEILSGQPANLCPDNRFGAVEVIALQRHAEKITVENKTGDDPATVRNDPEDAQCAFDDLEDVLCFVALEEDRLAGVNKLDRLPREQTIERFRLCFMKKSCCCAFAIIAGEKHGINPVV